MNLLPAILIGGPPNSGKSILFYGLTRALERLVLPSFYALRAAPDGEGHWTHEITPDARYGLRFKGQWNQRWVDVTCRDLAARTMPTLVDVGGLPTAEQEVIFDQCNYAILLTRVGANAEREHWRQLMMKHGLPILADVQSDLAGENHYVINPDGSVGGTLAGLQRVSGRVANGPAFDAIVERVHSVFDLPQDDIDGLNIAAAPKDSFVVDYAALTRSWYGAGVHWPESDVSRLVEATPANRSLAVYGAKPSWLCTALGARRTVGYVFDVRQGWVKPPAISVGLPNDERWKTHPQLELSIEWLGHQRARLRMKKRPEFYYLDYDSFHGSVFPHLPAETLLSLYGPMPLWLFASLGQAYRHLRGVIGEQGGETSNTQKP